jgi:serine/threonine-protein kinase SRPK3|eukprot:CAMPEP_0174291260 /NCGR_PEP_ID=MMETSP0809-20121228/31483_1 /TAXON_ID=73025 ORGANISM="Eutreptiella gymnastica-like, Strain CCMP1594" /NCGR_SAMPLE_ID=MMETSP0809 /ASSEMBLY_ACC=CAM_ASM_000658 /LENGTH=653 /DNA_ID=CAMNT_0015390461 /DNA_START=86 /DNA_END=2047 /DNA_ORIENTATION=-
MGKQGAAEAGVSKVAKNNAKQKQRRKKKKEQQQQKQQQHPDCAEQNDSEDGEPQPQWAKPKNEKPQPEDTYESHSEEDYSDTQQERKQEYRKGGYHPVTEGELYHNRYRVVKKLGWGYFSTVWLCFDHEENNFKAIKIQKSAQHYREAAYDEITLLTQIREGDSENTKCCCLLTDHFEHRGPNGRHVVMVFEVLGENLLQLIMKYDYKGIPIPVVKNITRQILIGLDYLHSKLHIIHTDLKPENVVVAMPQKAVQKAMECYTAPADRYRQISLIERDRTTLSKAQKKRLRKKLKMQKREEPGVHENASDAAGDSGACRFAENGKADAGQQQEKEEDSEDESTEACFARYRKVKLVDFGNACWTHKHFTDDIQTRQYRAPEVIVRNSYNTAVDIWSCACLVFELLTGDFLFDPQESEYIDRDEDHLALIVELLQTQPQVPSCLYARGGNEYVNTQGYLRHINHLKFWDLKSVLHEKYKFHMDKAVEIANFLLPMLSIDPSNRASANQVLQHPWLDPIPSDLEPFITQDIALVPTAHTIEDYYSGNDEWDEQQQEEPSSTSMDVAHGLPVEIYPCYVQQQMQMLSMTQCTVTQSDSSPTDHQVPDAKESDIDSENDPGTPPVGSVNSSPQVVSQDSLACIEDSVVENAVHHTEGS